MCSLYMLCVKYMTDCACRWVLQPRIVLSGVTNKLPPQAGPSPLGVLAVQTQQGVVSVCSP